MPAEAQALDVPDAQAGSHSEIPTNSVLANPPARYCF